jgi:hypothetical protein
VVAAGTRVAPGEAAGVAESTVTIPERAERAYVSLDDRGRAGIPIQSNRRMTKRTTELDNSRRLPLGSKARSACRSDVPGGLPTRATLAPR